MPLTPAKPGPFLRLDTRVRLIKRRLEGSADRSQYKDPDEVAAATLHALFAEQPKLRYMVVPNKEEARWT